MGVTTKVQRIEGDEELSQVMGEFDHWRAHRCSKKERIPEQLWQRAASLATRHGVSRVAALLHLERGGLGRRVSLASAGQPPVQVESNAPQFVEMFTPAPASASVPVQTTEPARTECVVEMVNVLGTKMRVELSGAGLAGLSTLCQAFCSAR
jgi:hypothetical protein